MNIISGVSTAIALFSTFCVRADVLWALSQQYSFLAHGRMVSNGLCAYMFPLGYIIFAIGALCIEGYLLHKYVSRFSYYKALFFAFCADVVSALVGMGIGWAIEELPMIGSPVERYVEYLEGISPIVGLISFIVPVYIISVLIKMLTLRVISGCTFEELFKPVTIGTLVVSILALIYWLLRYLMCIS